MNRTSSWESNWINIVESLILGTFERKEKKKKLQQHLLIQSEGINSAVTKIGGKALKSLKKKISNAGVKFSF